MVALAKSVAIALQDDSVRQEVFRALHASPYREHKLHFRTFTDGAGARLINAAAAASGRSVASMRAIRDSAIDLEFYMPVKSHFANWTGDANLLVATSFDADKDIPVAFALSGERVPLTSAKSPPTTPVLALVRTETRFSSGPMLTDCDPYMFTCDGEGSGGGSGPPLPGLYMTFSYINDDFEGFLNGSPEFEVFSNWRLTSDSTKGSYNQCSGASAGDPNRAGPGLKLSAYEYDQDDNTWTGLVRLLDSSQVIAAQAVDSAITYWVFEDDNTACEIKLEHVDDANSFYQALANQLTPGTPRAWRNRWTNNTNDPIWEYFLKTGWSIVSGLLASTTDDIVGVMGKPSTYSQSYTDANVSIVNPYQGIVGRAMLVRY